MNPIGIMTIFPKVKIHIIDGMMHGGVFAWICRCPPNAETVSVSSLKNVADYSGGVDGSHSLSINISINYREGSA